MRIWAWVFVGVCALGLGACNRRDGDAAERKVGKTAHEIAMESERAAKKAGREIGHAAREAREGWKEADKGKDKR